MARNQTVAEGSVLTGTEALLEELDEIERRRGTTAPTTAGTHEERTQRLGLSALCLSGGGIRSAAFCLGALQALAQRRVLREFDYLSTVSGGGFIGSCLTSLLSRSRHSKKKRTL